MTSGRIWTPEEGSGARGLCEPPQSPSRWVQGVTVPVECFAVTVTVHRRPQADVYGLHVQVADPHTKELLALIADPVRHALTSASVVGQITQELRAALLELTDPDPF